MEKKRRNGLRTVAIILAVIIGLLSLIPIPVGIKDGGSVHYQPVIPLYGVTLWNGMGHSEGMRTAGVTVTVFGIKVYSSFHEEAK